MNKLPLWLITLILFSVFTGIMFIPSVNSKKVIGSDIVTLSPVADSYVNQSSPDANYGGDTRLRIKCDDYYLYAYIMFDLSSLPTDANIIDAELWLTLTNADGYGDFGVTIGAHYCSDNSWSENGITWNNKPSFASEPTDTEGFWFVFLPSTDSWNVTVDVQTAFGSDKKLTEVMIFEEPETVWGWASFESREVEGVELEIEYTTKPIYTVEFESIQDTGNSSNLGNLIFASTTLTLPNRALIADGSYEAEYEGGYTFLRWETEGGVNVLDSNAQKTTVTVTDSGKLKAVGSAEVIQYFYDDSKNEWYTFEGAGEMVAVRFTPLFLGTLKKARFYIDRLSYSPPDTFIVHVMDGNLSDLITPFSQVVSSTGWLEVDLSAYNVSIQKDFYIGVEWPNDYYPCIGEDGSNPDERSFDWNGTAWKITKTTDYMIRAVVESEMPLRQIGIITCIPESEYISGGRNATVSGSITPIRTGVEVDLTYFRPDGSTVIRKAYTNATGEYTDSFMPDKVGSWRVMASWAGDEAYEGSESYPEEFTVSKSTSSIYLSYFYPTTITIGSSINLTGNIWPERFATIDLQYSLDEGQTWITFASANTTSNGDYSYTWTPISIGNYKLRTSWEGDEVCEGSVSSEKTLTVTETTKTFSVSIAGKSFDVKVTCNSTLSNFSFNQTEKMFSFQLMGISEMVGYCNVSFPKELLGGPFTIWINGSPPDTFSATSNGETSLHFTFNFGSICNVEIIGTTVIPEFQGIVVPMVMALTLLVIILRIRARRRGTDRRNSWSFFGDFCSIKDSQDHLVKVKSGSGRLFMHTV